MEKNAFTLWELLLLLFKVTDEVEGFSSACSMRLIPSFSKVGTRGRCATFYGSSVMAILTVNECYWETPLYFNTREYDCCETFRFTMRADINVTLGVTNKVIPPPI